MVLYKLMVEHWSIFTLFTQLLFCAAALTNANLNLLEHKSICEDDNMQYIQEKGSQSSLVLNLFPDNTKPFCKRQFHAPESHGFYVRLQRIPSSVSTSHKILQQSGMSKKYGSKKSSNSSDSCALSISHSLHGEVLPPWRLDPCELESLGSKDEPVRLLQGRLNIVWNHLGNQPAYRLLVTVIGNGAPCLEKDRHPCLEVDDVPLLCVSKALICDGIRHCPSSMNAISDEDREMCAKRNAQDLMDNPMEMVFKKYIQTTFKAFFYTDSTEVPSKDDSTAVKETKRIELIETQTKNNTKQHKSTLTGLSKYGPWGYLFLGMLLCGGALLICGLWECCCRAHKPELSDISGEENPSVFLESGISSSNVNITTGTTQSLPPYDELDPPPAYSVLFPNQKSSDNLPSLETGSPSENTTESSHGPAQAIDSAESVSVVHIQNQTSQ